MRRILWFILLLSAAAFAQEERANPSVKPAASVKKKPPAPAIDEDKRQPIDLVPEEEADVPPEEPEEQPQTAPTPVVAPKVPEVVKPKKFESKRADAPPKPVPVAAAFIVTKVTDSDLHEAWEKWRKTNDAFSADPKAEANARADLLRLKQEVAAMDLEPWSVAMFRSAARHEAEGSSAVAMEQASGALELSPHSPLPHFGMARAYFWADPSDAGRYLQAFRDGVRHLINEPRYIRPLIGDVGAMLITAWLLTTITVVVALTVRRGRYFLFDFHFLFPQSIPRWQSAAIAVVLLMLPLAFRLGTVPFLLGLLLATSLYLSRTELLVASTLVASLGGIPFVAGWLVDKTVFADTPAETVWQLEKGGADTEVIAREVARRAQEDRATAAELVALGTFELRRGKLDLAEAHLRGALVKSPNHPIASVNLGITLVLSGDLENSKPLLVSAKETAPELAAAWFNLARFHQRRIQILGVEAATGDIDDANVAMSEAKSRDPSLADRAEPPAQKLLANLYFLPASLSSEELQSMMVSKDANERVHSQVSGLILGPWSSDAAAFYPLLFCLLLVGLNQLKTTFGAARGCDKCGQPVSRRKDPELPPVSSMCAQCVNVYSKRGIVPTALKVQKQVEVARYQGRRERLAFGAGLLCSGLGHILKGVPVVGTLYLFFFTFAVTTVIFRDGVLRESFEAFSSWVVLAPACIVLLILYARSVLGLRKRQEVT